MTYIIYIYLYTLQCSHGPQQHLQLLRKSWLQRLSPHRSATVTPIHYAGKLVVSAELHRHTNYNVNGGLGYNVGQWRRYLADILSVVDIPYTHPSLFTYVHWSLVLLKFVQVSVSQFRFQHTTMYTIIVISKTQTSHSTRWPLTTLATPNFTRHTVSLAFIQISPSFPFLHARTHTLQVHTCMIISVHVLFPKKKKTLTVPI